MQLRLNDQREVILFTASITVVATAVAMLMNFLLLTPELFASVWKVGVMVAILLSAGISYFVGSQIRRVSQLTARLEHLVDHDNLTGLSTRKAFFDRLGGDAGLPASIIVADIDHFKKVNDTHGHGVGDLALVHFARTLRRNCRETDVICRFGGEEFLIFLPDTNGVEGYVVAERLRVRLSETIMDHDNIALRMTASFGVCELNSSEDVDAVIKKADEALYEAKNAGRNRVQTIDISVPEELPALLMPRRKAS